MNFVLVFELTKILSIPILLEIIRMFVQDLFLYSCPVMTEYVCRVFALIENSAQEHIHGDVTKLNPEQKMLEVGLSSTFTSVLQQCSAAIFTVRDFLI